MKTRFLTVAVLALCACQEDPLMRMYEQKKAKAFAHSNFWADGRVNRTPPMGTVARERPLELEKAMPPMTMELLKKGQKRFNIVCATCHGVTGESDTIVASNFSQRQPPSFHEQRLREKSDEYIFTAMSVGYGVMPAFPEIPVEERWAVVGYVRALQVSQRANLEMAPPEVQAKLQAAPAETKEEKL